MTRSSPVRRFSQEPSGTKIQSDTPSEPIPLPIYPEFSGSCGGEDGFFGRKPNHKGKRNWAQITIENMIDTHENGGYHRCQTRGDPSDVTWIFDWRK